MAKAILALLFLLLVAGINMLLGAVSIDLAVDNFIRKRYFRFGINIMMFISFACGMIQILIVDI